LEEEHAYTQLTQHHTCEPMLGFLLCRNDQALVQAMAVGLAKYFSETPLVEVGTELQVCDITTSMIADLKYMVCFKKCGLGKKGKCVAAKHRCVISAAILAVVAADAEGGRAAVDAVEVQDAVYSETASVTSISGKASPDSESEAKDY